jgi:uncharacterized protein involved in exopolysaccharide biosynthesis
MSIEFRQRTTGEYLSILRRRKWLIILPVIALTAAVSWVVYRLPDVYESTTLIVVRPSTLPSSVVPTSTEGQYHASIERHCSSCYEPYSLEPLVERYELYKLRSYAVSRWKRSFDMMRNDIKVEVNTSRNDITNGFNITFRGRDPRVTQAITQELAAKYINEQTRNQVNSGVAAKTFIDNQVRQAKDELDAVDKERLDFMTNNVGNLPSEAASLAQQLGGLREQQKALMSEIGRLQDRRSAAITQLALVKKSVQNQIETLAEDVTDPKTTLAWSQLVTRKASLEGELTKLKQELREKHPDVISKQKEIDQVKQDMDDMITSGSKRLKTKNRSSPDVLT